MQGNDTVARVDHEGMNVGVLTGIPLAMTDRELYNVLWLRRRMLNER
jgi:hypothetical protein